MVWYSRLFKKFPQFVVIHTFKGFSMVKETEVGVYDPMKFGNLISGSSTFTKPSLYIWKFSVHILLKPGLKYFEHNLINMQNECNCPVV